MNAEQFRCLIIAILAAPQLVEQQVNVSEQQLQVMNLIRNYDPVTGRPYTEEQKVERARERVTRILQGCLWTADRLLELLDLTPLDLDS